MKDITESIVALRERYKLLNEIYSSMSERGKKSEKGQFVLSQKKEVSSQILTYERSKKYFRK